MSQLELFDYSSLTPSTRLSVEGCTVEIRNLVRRSGQDIIAIGGHLSEVKALLPHGQFGAWLKTEFDWSERTARKLMAVYETFKTAQSAEMDIAPSALYLLAEPNTPEAARQEAIDRAEAGERVSYTEAKTLISAHRESEQADAVDASDARIARHTAPTNDKPQPTGDMGRTRLSPPEVFQLELEHAKLPASVTHKCPKCGFNW